MPDNCQLRPVAPADAERMLRWLLDPEVADNFGMRSRPTLRAMQQWIGKASTGQETHAWAILHRGAHVGNVMLDCIDTFLQSARLSIYLGEASARGQGVASHAVRLALEEGFSTHGLERIWLTVHERNTRAALLYTRAGFRIEGVLRQDFIFRGERINSILMSLLRMEFIANNTGTSKSLDNQT